MGHSVISDEVMVLVLIHVVDSEELVHAMEDNKKLLDF